MLVKLPAELEIAIEQELKHIPKSQWLKAAQSLSEHYRDTLAYGKVPTVRGDLAALAYAAIILPSTFAQLSGALAATGERLPADWQPETLLDIGSGPGTALWVAAQIWPGLQSITAWEREPAFISLGQKLAKASSWQSLRQANWERLTISKYLPTTSQKYDLIILGHVVNELSPDLRKPLLDYVWEHSSGVILLVEPGTPAAFAIVREMREYLLKKGAFTLAPCAHDNPCPLQDDWCHFPQKIERPDFQRRAKEGTAGWEESKFSYVAVSKTPPQSTIWGRLIHQPQVPRKNKTFVELPVSTRDGILNLHISKLSRDLYDQAKHLHWGDILPTPQQFTQENNDARVEPE